MWDAQKNNCRFQEVQNSSFTICTSRRDNRKRVHEDFARGKTNECFQFFVDLTSSLHKTDCLGNCHSAWIFSNLAQPYNIDDAVTVLWVREFIPWKHGWTDRPVCDYTTWLPLHTLYRTLTCIFSNVQRARWPRVSIKSLYWCCHPIKHVVFIWWGGGTKFHTDLPRAPISLYTPLRPKVKGRRWWLP